MTPGLPGAFAGAPALRLSRWYEASADAVFRAFTEPDVLKEWFRPRGFTMERIDFDARVGGRYGARLRAADGTLFEYAGVVLEVVPPVRLSYTWRWLAGPMHRAETLVELTFTEERGGVRVDVCHSRFVSEEECDSHGTGWRETLDRLGERLSPPSSSQAN